MNIPEGVLKKETKTKEQKEKDLAEVSHGLSFSICCIFQTKSQQFTIQDCHLTKTDPAEWDTYCSTPLYVCTFDVELQKCPHPSV